jgi:hypothetical protein
MPGDRRRYAIAYAISIFIHAVALLVLAVLVLQAIEAGGEVESALPDTTITVETQTPDPALLRPSSRPVHVARIRVAPVPAPRPRTAVKPRPKPPVPHELAHIAHKAPPQPTPLPAPVVAETLPSAPPLPRPTSAPTVAPTQRPTVAPTQRPTVAPTERPTIAPTERPTVAPTERPTIAPTERPTIAPTERPTIAPTERPTIAPTERPTIAPTEPPTSAPTQRPTAAPTAVAVRPTAAPSPIATARVAAVAPRPAGTRAAEGATTAPARVAHTAVPVTAPAAPAAPPAAAAGDAQSAATAPAGEATRAPGLGSLNDRLRAALPTKPTAGMQHVDLGSGYTAGRVMDAYEQSLAPPLEILAKTFGLIYTTRTLLHAGSVAYVFERTHILGHEVCRAYQITEHPQRTPTLQADHAIVAIPQFPGAKQPDLKPEKDIIIVPCDSSSIIPVPLGSITTPVPRVRP